MVEPEVTVLGPVSVTVGAVPLLWHDVQVEPFLPENPEMPLLVALTGTDELMTTNVSRATQCNAIAPNLLWFFGFLAWMRAAGTLEAAPSIGRNFLCSTVASFLRLSYDAVRKPRGTKDAVVQMLQPIRAETHLGLSN